MDQTQLIGFFVSIFLIVLWLFLKVFFKKIAKKLFAGLSQSQLNRVFSVILMVGIIGTILTINLVISTPEAPPIENPEPKSEIEQAVDDVKTVAEALGDLASQKRKRDSTLLSNKSNRWVYQIGDPINNRRQLGEAFKDLNSKLSNLLVFKRTRRNYSIILDDGNNLSKAILESLIPSLKLSLKGIENHITVIDLNAQCRARQEIQETKPTKIRKADDLPTVECK